MTKDEALKMALEAFGEIDWSNNSQWQSDRAKVAIATLKEALAQPEFIKHEVKNADDWSEWVCPDPKNYLMKCCDCGLVHEAEFAVVRYKSKTERDDCDMVNDPNLQAVFRMRRSEEWTPEDTAHRVGGLPMAQPEQEPVAWLLTDKNINSLQVDSIQRLIDRLKHAHHTDLCVRINGQDEWFQADWLKHMVRASPPQRTWVGLTKEERHEISMANRPYCADIMAAHEEELKRRNT